MITLAVLFVVVLFLAKKTDTFEKATALIHKSQNGLTYDDSTIGELTGEDEDEDGVLDWQEFLYGLDSTKKETVAGIPDITTFNKMKDGQNLTTEEVEKNGENLTETEKFSRELFSIATSISQDGGFNQTLTEQIGFSLAEKIKNSTQKKVFVLSDLKITEATLPATYTNYSNNVMEIWKQNNKNDSTVTEVLERFVNDQKNVNPEALKDLDPIIESTNKIIEEMLQVSVPRIFAYQHLNYLNATEKIVENLSDLRLFETDPIVSLSGISQYEKNLESYLQALQNLADTVNQKISENNY